MCSAEYTDTQGRDREPTEREPRWSCGCGAVNWQDMDACWRCSAVHVKTPGPQMEEAGTREISGDGSGVALDQIEDLRREVRQRNVPDKLDAGVAELRDRPMQYCLTPLQYTTIADAALDVCRKWSSVDRTTPDMTTSVSKLFELLQSVGIAEAAVREFRCIRCDFAFIYKGNEPIPTCPKCNDTSTSNLTERTQTGSNRTGAKNPPHISRLETKETTLCHRSAPSALWPTKSASREADPAGAGSESCVVMIPQEDRPPPPADIRDVCKIRDGVVPPACLSEISDAESVPKGADNSAGVGSDSAVFPSAQPERPQPPAASAAIRGIKNPPDVVSVQLADDIGRILDELSSVVDAASDGPRLAIMEHVDAIAAIARGKPKAAAESAGVLTCCVCGAELGDVCTQCNDGETDGPPAAEPAGPNKPTRRRTP